MKVRIVSCSVGDTAWYHVMIGKVIDVSDEFFYKNADTSWYERIEKIDSDTLINLTNKNLIFKKFIDRDNIMNLDYFEFFISINDMVPLREDNLKELGI